jgi:hypothetical protein
VLLRVLQTIGVIKFSEVAAGALFTEGIWAKHDILKERELLY